MQKAFQSTKQPVVCMHLVLYVEENLRSKSSLNILTQTNAGLSLPKKKKRYF